MLKKIFTWYWLILLWGAVCAMSFEMFSYFADVVKNGFKDSLDVKIFALGLLVFSIAITLAALATQSIIQESRK